MVDYYEFLQISPNAEADTIHRVYRFLAARLHPDNLQSGNAEMFHLLKLAYDVLSDTEKRAKYDVARMRASAPPPLSETVDFMDSLDGELNRRLAVLAVLYYRRRTNPNFPQVSLADIEDRMGFPRDYLEFTLWYLVKKGYVSREDNASYSLTAEAVDFVEKHRTEFPILHRLLTSTAGATVPNAAYGHGTDAPVTQAVSAAPKQTASGPIVLPASMENGDRRVGRPDRRAGLPDLRVDKVERRVNSRDRRGTLGDRRGSGR
jgi:DNA-binding MarR family transcriptional regulator